MLARASSQLHYGTCHCFWSKDHPAEAARGGHTARASLLTPSELTGGAGIWTLQELAAPPPAPEPNLQDTGSSFFVHFQQTRLSQSLWAALAPWGTVFPTLAQGLFSWRLALTLSDLGFSKTSCPSTITLLTSDALLPEDDSFA